MWGLGLWGVGGGVGGLYGGMWGGYVGIVDKRGWEDIEDVGSRGGDVLWG